MLRFVTVSMISLEVMGSKGSKGSKGSEVFSNELMNTSVIISFEAPKNLEYS